MDAKDIYVDLKEKRAALHEKVKDLAAKNQPAHDLKKYAPSISIAFTFLISNVHDAIRKLEDKYIELDKERDLRKEAARAKFRELKAKYDTSEKLVHSAFLAQ